MMRISFSHREIFRYGFPRRRSCCCTAANGRFGYRSLRSNLRDNTTHGGTDPRFHIGGVDAEFFNSSAGLRGYRGRVFEGGLRVHCIVKWPNHVKPGSTCDVASYFPDWFVTLCNVAKAPLPHTQQLDGINLVSVLQGGTPPVRDELMI